MTMSNLATTAQARKLGPTRPKAMKHRPNNKPPIKVVYISSPMKVKASVSQFRALVQRLTGRDSEVPDDHTTEYEDGISTGGRVDVGEVEVAVGDDVSKGLGDDGHEEVVVSSGNNNKSLSSSVETTSSCEVGELVGGGGGARGYHGDEFLMGGGDDCLFPVLGSEAFLWTWMC